MRRMLMTAALLAAASPACAASADYTTGLTPLASGREALVTIGSICRGDAKYVATFTRGQAGAVLKRVRGSVARRDAATFALVWQGDTPDDVVLHLTVTCRGDVAPDALVSVYVRDAVTHAPLATVAVQEGAGL